MEVDGFDENALKRLIRVMNSVLNLYDEEKIPIEVIDIMYQPIAKLASVLKIPVKSKEIDGRQIIEKFVMPENFERWLETNGEVQE